jgi:predicted small lipoprotein YifL
MNHPVRYAIAAALALALGLAGCGRKGSLDPPPGGLAEPSVYGSQPAAPGPDGQVAATVGPNGQPAPPPAAKKPTPLDWLLN